MESVEELVSSELGTKDYWDKSYKTEIKNYKSHGECGEIWFDEDSQLRVINWMLKNETIKKGDNIIDLGCGNGMILIELSREGYTDLTGVDYSANAVELAQCIANDQNIQINYKVADLLADDIEHLGRFSVIHDKGTYDAISLHPEDTKTKRLTYIKNMTKILKDDGYFILTSCNWTFDELEKSFIGYFKVHCSIPTPTFMFGGKVGNVVTSLVLKKQL